MSSKLMFPRSDIIFHPNRKYQGATLLVLLGSNAYSGPVSGPQHPSPPLKILYPEHSATVCVCLHLSSWCVYPALTLAHKMLSTEL